MDINIIYSEDKTGVLWLSGETITSKDVIEANIYFLQNEKFKDVRYLIVNFLNCSNFLIPSQDVQKIAEQDIEASKINTKIHVAVLTGDAISYNTAKLWESMITETGWQTSVFETKREGIEWIQNKLNQTIPNKLLESSYRANPITISYDENLNLLTHRGVGKIMLADFINFYRNLSLYNLKPNYKVIADYSEAYTELSFEDLQTMSQRRAATAKSMGTISIALIVNSDLKDTISSLYKILLNKEYFNVKQFDNLPEAEAWLNI